MMSGESHRGLTVRLLQSWRELALAVAGTVAVIADSESAPNFLPPFPGEPRAYTTAVLDPTSQSIWFYGGSNQGGRLNDLWRFDLASESWENIKWNGAGPPPLNLHPMAYEASENRLIIFGGYGPPAFPGDLSSKNELWEYLLSDHQWRVTESLDPGNPLPIARTQMIVDEDGRKVWTFLGAVDVEPVGVLLTLDLDTKTWTYLGLERGDPTSRVDHVAALEIPGRSVLLFGGKGMGSILSAERVRSHTMVWRFDLDSLEWTPLTDGLDRPLQDEAVGAFDVLSGLFLVFGGRGGESVGPYPYYESDEVWAFDPVLNTWTVLSPQGNLVHRRSASGVYCPCTGEFLIIGGRTSFYNTFPSPEEMAFAIPIELPARFSWEGAPPSETRRSPWRWGTLHFPNDGPAVPGIEDGSVRLVNCETGRTLQVADKVLRVGQDRWRIRFRSLDEDASRAADQGRLVVTGRPIGAAVNFHAKCGDAADPVVGGPYERYQRPNIGVDAAQANPVSIERSVSGWTISYANPPGDAVDIYVYDVKGRIQYRASSTSTANGSDRTATIHWGGRSVGGARLPAGIYLIRLTSGASQVSRKVFLY